MRRALLSITFMSLSLVLWSFSPESIVPRPAFVEVSRGNFRLSGATFYCSPSLPAEAEEMVADFVASLSFVSGKQFGVTKEEGRRCISFELCSDYTEEEYSIDIKRTAVNVKAGSAIAVLWAIQTLKQLLPVEIYGNILQKRAVWKLKCCSIHDIPRFAHRGLMIDPARRFITVEQTKKILRIMSIYKMNRLHWHLTDDQGWRIEVKSLPRLTDVGSIRQSSPLAGGGNIPDGTPHSGFYTQDEIRDIVSYAAGLGIEIIPEIDLPGHMLAALASYPELGCTGGPYEVRTRWGVSSEVLCPGKEGTFVFLEKVLAEVAELFPGELFHIGGDECPTTEWEKCLDCQKLISKLGYTDQGGSTAERKLQLYFCERARKFLEERGKRVICWNEITAVNPDKNTVIMEWNGCDPAPNAMRNGYDVIRSPKWYCYLDYIPGTNLEKEPKGQERILTLETLYSFEPEDTMYPGTLHKMMGVQYNLWGEHMTSDEVLEYMLLPRLAAGSEVAWSPKGSKDYQRLNSSLVNHQQPIYEYLGYNYRPQK